MVNSDFYRFPPGSLLQGPGGLGHHPGLGHHLSSSSSSKHDDHSHPTTNHRYTFLRITIMTRVANLL